MLTIHTCKNGDSCLSLDSDNINSFDLENIKSEAPTPTEVWKQSRYCIWYLSLSLSWAASSSVTHHVNHLRVDGLGDDVTFIGDVLHHLAQRRPLDLLPFQVTQRVGGKIEQHAALSQLLDEQLLLFGRGHIWKSRRNVYTLYLYWHFLIYTSASGPLLFTHAENGLHSTVMSKRLEMN